MNVQRANTIREAERMYREARGSSYTSLTNQEQQGHRAGNEERVRKMWLWLAAEGHLPCSMHTAARVVTDRFGEHHFTPRQTNADVIRKRTADLVQRVPSPIVRVGDGADPDGVRRDQYELAGTSSKARTDA